MLLSADGLSNVAVAERVGVNQATVVKWRKRFIEGGVDGLIDEPRPGASRKISDADVEEVIVRTLEDKPTDATYWSTRNLAKTGISLRRLECRRRRWGALSSPGVWKGLLNFNAFVCR